MCKSCANMKSSGEWKAQSKTKLLKSEMNATLTSITFTLTSE